MPSCVVSFVISFFRFIISMSPTTAVNEARRSSIYFRIKKFSFQAQPVSAAAHAPKRCSHRISRTPLVRWHVLECTSPPTRRHSPDLAWLSTRKPKRRITIAAASHRYTQALLSLINPHTGRANPSFLYPSCAGRRKGSTTSCGV